MRITRLAAFIALAFACVASTTFAQSFTSTSYPTGPAPAAVVSADINRDGHPDLISADSRGFITVLLGTSTGKFINNGNFATAQLPVALAVGDFNHDGFPDVVVLELSGFQLFLSAHNGALIPQPAVSFSGFGKSIVAVDLNGDHIPDLALTFCASGGSPCTLRTLLNNGSGHFTTAQDRPLDASFFNSLVAADFDRDGHDDLAVASGVDVFILHSNNNGTTTFRQALSPTETQQFFLAAGDIDARNGPDLVFTSSPSCAPNCIENFIVHEYLNNGSSTLLHKADFSSNSNSLSKFVFSDITADNRLDLLAVSSALQEENGFVNWAHNIGNGTFGAFTLLEELFDGVDMIARDFNLDSRHDLAVADRGLGGTPETTVFLNTAFSALCPPPNSANLAAKLCTPGSTASSNTITVLAAGNSPTGVRRVELWIDGVKRYNSPDDRLKTTVTVPAGTHKFQIVAVDQFGTTAFTTRFVSVP